MHPGACIWVTGTVCVHAHVPGMCGTCFFNLRVAVSHECLCHVLVSSWCVCVCVCGLPAEVHHDPWTLPYTGGTSEWRWWPLEDQSLGFIIPFLQALLLLLLLLSRFSRVRLCATPWTAAYQASPSMGFSRQVHWSGLPFPSSSPEHHPFPIPGLHHERSGKNSFQKPSRLPSPTSRRLSPQMIPKCLFYI